MVKQLSVSVFLTEAWEIYHDKLTAKIDLTKRHFYVAISDAEIGSLKSLHTIFDMYLHQMLVRFEQNRMV